MIGTPKVKGGNFCGVDVFSPRLKGPGSIFRGSWPRMKKEEGNDISGHGELRLKPALGLYCVLTEPLPVSLGLLVSTGKQDKMAPCFEPT